MKKLSKLALLILGFVSGVLSGAFIRLGFEMLAGRPSSVGGEALILPLIVVLIIFGFSLGRMFTAQQQAIHAHDKAYQRGYIDGVAKMTQEVAYEFSHNKGVTLSPSPDQSGL